MKYYIGNIPYGNHLTHHGIKGQRWGIRRYQNLDGTLTPAGKARYSSDDVVFISGSSKTQLEGEYQRKKLPKAIRSHLNQIIRSKAKVVVGDAPGIDRQVQDYLSKRNYSNVEVYGPGTKVRYAANKKWKTNPIDAPQYEAMSKEWLAAKDIEMTKVSTKGLAVVLDEGAKATRKNVERLIESQKDVYVYELSKQGKRYDKWIDMK